MRNKPERGMIERTVKVKILVFAVLLIFSVLYVNVSANGTKSSPSKKTPLLKTRSIDEIIGEKKGKSVQRTGKQGKSVKQKTETRTEEYKEKESSVSPLSAPKKSGLGLLKKPKRAETPPRINDPKPMKDNINEDINR